MKKTSVQSRRCACGRLKAESHQICNHAFRSLQWFSTKFQLEDYHRDKYSNEGKHSKNGSVIMKNLIFFHCFLVLGCKVDFIGNWTDNMKMPPRCLDILHVLLESSSRASVFYRNGEFPNTMPKREADLWLTVALSLTHKPDRMLPAENDNSLRKDKIFLCIKASINSMELGQFYSLLWRLHWSTSCQPTWRHFLKLNAS